MSHIGCGYASASINTNFKISTKNCKIVIHFSIFQILTLCLKYVRRDVLVDDSLLQGDDLCCRFDWNKLHLCIFLHF